MSDLREFRDGLADQPASTSFDARGVDPYAAPTTVAQAPRGLKLPRPPRLSPEWTILLGLVPYFASLVVGVVGLWQVRDETLLVASAFIGFETVVYLGRTFWTGAGAASSRMPTSALSMAVVICTPALHSVLAGETWIQTRQVGTAVLGFVIWGGLCLATNAFLFAIGSRDVPSRRTRSDRPSRRFVPALIAAGTLLGTAAPFAIRPQMLAVESVGLDATPVGMLMTVVVASSALCFMTQTWRWGVRGWRRPAGWSMAFFVIAALLSVAPLVFTSLAYFFSDDPPPNAWTPFLVFLVVPVVREVFIRWAGYRAINVYAERRRARRRALRIRGDNSRIEGGLPEPS